MIPIHASKQACHSVGTSCSLHAAPGNGARDGITGTLEDILLWEVGGLELGTMKAG